MSFSDGHSMYELGRGWTEVDGLDLEERTNFVSSLRKSIRNTNNQTPKREKNALFGASDHFVDLVFVVNVAPRIGLGELF